MLLQLLILEYMQKADEEILELKYHHVTQIRMKARGAKREKKEEKTRRILSTLIWIKIEERRISWKPLETNREAGEKAGSLHFSDERKLLFLYFFL